ncbi:MAG TPA: hypothetical protein VGP80_10090 [Gemmatimonadales bacterium]|nr:hypothetical protein [Gemmatimonadales bacterium]
MNLRLAWYGLGIIALAACDADGVAPPATVYFVIDAPLCSSLIPVQFFIDNTQVGADTFRVNLAPDHTMSAGFEINSGRHTLGARVVNGYVWADRSVRVAAGEVVHDSLPFYCS